MELTIEIARRAETGEPELLAREDVAVEGLESPEQLERPLYLDIHVRMRAEEPPLAEPESMLVQAQREPPARPAAAAVIEPEQPSEHEAEDQLIEESQEGVAEEEPQPATEAERAAPAEPEPAAAGGAAAQVAATPAKRMDSASDSPVLEVVEEATQPAAPEAEAEGAVTAEAEPAPGAEAEAGPPLLEVSEVEVAAPSAETVDEFAQQLAAVAESVPQPDIATDGAPLRAAGGSGASAMRGHRGGLRPQEILDPRPIPPEPPAATAENPVPRALWLIDRESQHTLEDQTPPALERRTETSPMPRLGDQALSESEFSAVVRFGREFDQRAFEASGEDPLLMMSIDRGESMMSIPPLTPEEEHIRDVYQRMKQPPPVEEPPQPQAIKTEPEPPLVPPLRRAEPTDVANVFSYLLARPAETADAALRDVRASIAPGDAVNREFPDLGSSRLPALQAELERQFRDIAIQAGASAAQLDEAISQRRLELERRERDAQFGICQSYADAEQMFSQEDALASLMTESGADAMVSHAQSVQQEAAEVTPSSRTEATRDRLLEQAHQRTGGYNAHYRRMLETRHNALNAAERRYASAYRYAAQREELDATENSDFSPEERQALITDIRTWGERRQTAVRDTFAGFRTEATNATNGFKSQLEIAARQAFEEIRDWAAAELGQVRDFEERFNDDLNEWALQAEADAAAWQAVQNGRQAAIANSYIEFYAGLRDSQADAARQEEILGDERLGQDRRMIASAYFGRAVDATGGRADPIQVIAGGVRTRFMDTKRNELSDALWEELRRQENWRGLSAVGAAMGPVPDSMETRARTIHDVGLHGGVFGTNEVGTVMTALTGLNELQQIALSKAYQEFYGMTLDADLQHELDARGELDRARDLLSAGAARSRAQRYRAEAAAATSDEERRRALAAAEQSVEQSKRDDAAAAAAQLYAAGPGQAGTDEDTIFRVLRGLTGEQRTLVERLYRERYGQSLSDMLESELHDWATSTTHDAERGQALLQGDKARADAIAVDQAMYFRFWGPNREEVERIYAEARDDIREQARREGRDSEWVRVQAQQHARNIEARYNERFEGQVIEGREQYEYDQRYGGTPPELFRRGTLRENYGRLFSDADSDVLLALADDNLAGADAARIEAERQGYIYSSDSTINDVLASQYDRARQDAELDDSRALRYMEEQRVQAEEEQHFRTTGRFWTPEFRYERQQRLELNVERAIDSRAEHRAGDAMRTLASTYADRYPGHTLQSVVTRNVSGTAQTAAQSLIDRGYLTPYERLRYGIEGAGTREDLVKAALRGRTREELAEIDRLWRRDHEGESLRDALSGDLSGDDWIDAQVALDGRPMTLDDSVRVAELRAELTKPGWFGAAIFGDENVMVAGALEDLRALREQIRDPRSAALPPSEQQGLLSVFAAQRDAVDAAIEARNQITSSVTDSIVNVVSIAAALVAGTVLSFFTAGLAGAVMVAVFASLLATSTSIALRAALMGNRYGLEQFGVDVAIGVVDAIVAGLTAGMGSRLLGIRQIAVGAAERTAAGPARQAAQRSIFASLRQAMGRQIGPLAQRTRAIAFLERMAAEEASWYSRLAAHGVSQVIENTVQGMPSAVLAAALDEENYKHGNAFLNIVSGAGTQLAMGVAQGMAFSAGHQVVSKAAGHAWRFAVGPELGTGTYRRGPAQMSPAEFEAHYRDFEQAHPGATRERFRGVLEQEQARVRERAEAQVEQRRQVRDEMNEALRASSDPEISALAGRLDDVPITRLSAAEYARVAGIGAPDVVIIERGGQMHIVVREGASPAAIREHAAALAARVEPGTGGRVKNLADVLPRDLREAVRIEPGAGLLPREVRVYPFPDVHIVAGPGATAADIRLHLRVARAQVRLQGAHGRVLQMLEQIRIWRFEHGTPGPNTRAFEAHFEVQKLPEIIRARQAELANPDLHPNQRIEIEGSIRSLLEQLDRHSRTLADFDLSPGRGFIAAEGVKGKADVPPEEMARTRDADYGDALIANHERFPRVPLDSSDPGFVAERDGSPLSKRDEVRARDKATNQEGRVFRVGDYWNENGRTFRLVEAVDGSGKRIDMYQEVISENGYWVKRGSESNVAGRAFEIASEMRNRQLIENEMFSFLIDMQNKSGHGFDQARLHVDTAEVVRDPTTGEWRFAREDYAPRLVVGEDKRMQQVTWDSITAIKEHLLQNFQEMLIERLFRPGASMTFGPEAMQHLEPSAAAKSHPFGEVIRLSRLYEEALRRALFAGNIEFEITIRHGESLADPDAPGAARRSDYIVKRLREYIGEALELGYPAEVRRLVLDDPKLLHDAEAVIGSLYKIGQEAPASRVAAEVFGGKPNSEQFRQAWALERAADLLHASGLRPAGKTGLATDAQNRLFAVQSMAATDFSGGNLELRVDGILNHLGTRVGNGANGLYSNWMIVDTTRLTPEQTSQLRSTLLDRAAKSGRLADLRRVIRLGEEGGEAGRLFSDQEIALAAAKASAAGGRP